MATNDVTSSSRPDFEEVLKPSTDNSADRLTTGSFAERQTTTGSAVSFDEDKNETWEKESVGTSSSGLTLPSLRPERAVTTSTQKLSEKYDILEKLGQGAFGEVSLVANAETGEKLAAKLVRFDTIDRRNAVENEFEISSRLQHPNIVKVHDMFMNDDRCYLVVDLCTGGDMVDLVESRKHEVQGVTRRVYIPPSGKVLATLLCQMLDSVRYLHHHNMVHRDIKLDNFLIGSSELNDLKLIDFGMAKTIQKDQLLTGVVGTMGYMAPEVLEEVGYGFACDSWSVGVCAYMLLAGLFPIPVKDHGTHAEIAALTKRHEIDHKRYAQLPIPREGKDIPSLLLQLDPTTRTSPKQILSANRWLRTVGRGQVDACCTIS